MFQRLSLTVFSFLSVALASFAALANDNIDAVIEKVRTPSYDCPNQSLLPELENTLEILCPTNPYQTNIFQPDKDTWFLLKHDDYYEPIYLYEQKGDK